jgi:hypothetical protein
MLQIYNAYMQTMVAYLNLFLQLVTMNCSRYLTTLNLYMICRSLNSQTLQQIYALAGSLNKEKLRYCTGIVYFAFLSRAWIGLRLRKIVAVEVLNCCRSALHELAASLL